ncbi:MAG: sigma-54 dependent transcriptional regulator [Myxococcota bacterium]
MATVLIIDDNDTLREGAVAVATRMGHRVYDADGGAPGLELLRAHGADVVLTDLKMDGLDGIAVLEAVKNYDPDIAVVIITAFGTIENAVEAIKKGAHDYVQKPFSPDNLRHRLNRALEWREDRRTRTRLEATQEVLSGARDFPRRHDPEGAFEGMIGSSPAMQKIFKMIEKVARGDTAVAVGGESGTGKELVATAIHRRSPRAEGPLIKVNCGAIPESLMESELFGHERGAFTGAVKRKLGRFELADGGTIFLDEIAELPLSMQVKLLRVLQEKVVDRVGGEQPVPIDVRIISATNRDLAAEVEAGRFREDLYYRLHVVPLRLPPLRERTEDIIPLARHFAKVLRARTLSDVEGFTAEAEQRLATHHFPGNVRELVNVVEQALVFADPPLIGVEDLPSAVGGEPGSSDNAPRRGSMTLPDFLEAIERREILDAYETSGGVKTETARKLGIKTSALYYKLEKYGVGTINSRD